MKNHILKYLCFVFIITLMFHCKPEEIKPKVLGTETLLIKEKNQEKKDSINFKDTNEIEKIVIETNEIKIAPIKNSIDDTEIIIDYLQHKQFLKETDGYTITFCYPYLNEKYNTKFESFNNYIKNELLELPEIEQNILETQELLCDNSGLKPSREYRLANYKVFLQNENHLSILFYIENHYTHTKATYYTFEAINFDMKDGALLTYDDYFNFGTTEEVLAVLNEEIRNNINDGEKYYECFEISLEDFKEAKNDFVINDDKIVFYFNDCVMCPSYLGTHEIEILYEKLRPFLKTKSKDRFEVL